MMRTRMCLLTESNILIVLHHHRQFINSLTDAVPPRRASPTAFFEDKKRMLEISWNRKLQDVFPPQSHTHQITILRKITSLPKFAVRCVRSVPPLLLNPFKFKLEWTETWFSTFILFFESLLKRTLDHFSVAYLSKPPKTRTC